MMAIRFGFQAESIILLHRLLLIKACQSLAQTARLRSMAEASGDVLTLRITPQALWPTYSSPGDMLPRVAAFICTAVRFVTVCFPITSRMMLEKTIMGEADCTL